MAYYFFMFRWHVVVRFSRNGGINITENDIGLFDLVDSNLSRLFARSLDAPCFTLGGRINLPLSHRAERRGGEQLAQKCFCR